MNILLTGAGGVYVKHLIKRLDRKIFDKIIIVDEDFKSIKKINADYVSSTFRWLKNYLKLKKLLINIL